MSSTCIFEFNRIEPVYFGGETINGQILLKTTKEKVFKEIFIQFIGESKTRWIVSKAVHIRKKRLRFNKTYSGQETYIHTHKTLHTEEEGTLAPGIHEYSFTIALPDDLPSSCEEVYGYINYEISLVIDRSHRFKNIFRQPLTVLSALNLNAYVELMHPIKCEDRIHFCCWPCRSGPVVSSLTIPFGGFVPGQDIPFSIHITNKSKLHSVRHVKLRFLQSYVFHSEKPSMKTSVVILTETVNDDTVPRASERTINGCFKVPAVPPTTRGKFLITVSYFIEMVFGGISWKFSKIIVPVIIGTVPLVQSPISSEGAPVPSSALTCAPTFEEIKTIKARFVDVEADGHSSRHHFLPKYPMYAPLIFSSTYDRVARRRSSQSSFKRQHPGLSA